MDSIGNRIGVVLIFFKNCAVKIKAIYKLIENKSIRKLRVEADTLTEREL